MSKILNLKEIDAIRVAPIYHTDKVANEYLNEQNEIIRLYHYMLSSRKESPFLGMVDSHIEFPTETLYYESKDYITGHTKPLIKGIDFNYGFYSREDIEKLLEAYNKGIETISRYPDIRMYELYKENMNYSVLNHSFNFLVTDSWKVEENSLEENLKQFNAMLMYVLLYGNLSELNDLNDNFDFLRNPKLKELYLLFKNHQYTTTMFGEFLMLLTEFTSKEKGKVKKIGELKNN